MKLQLSVAHCWIIHISEKIIILKVLINISAYRESHEQIPNSDYQTVHFDNYITVSNKCSVVHTHFSVNVMQLLIIVSVTSKMRDTQNWGRFGLAHRMVTALKWGVNELKRWELPWQTLRCLCQQYLTGHLHCQRNSGSNNYWTGYRGCSNSKVTDSQKHEMVWHFICFHSFIACMFVVYVLSLLMDHVIQGKPWCWVLNHVVWWPAFEPPPYAFDVINYKWSIILLESCVFLVIPPNFTSFRTTTPYLQSGCVLCLAGHRKYSWHDYYEMCYNGLLHLAHKTQLIHMYVCAHGGCRLWRRCWCLIFCTHRGCSCSLCLTDDMIV